MAEDSKTGDDDYVMIGSVMKLPTGLENPSLSQEDRDHRLAIALQQEEMAAAADEKRKKYKETAAAHENRTSRSNTFTRLAAIRDKDHGMLSVPADYTTENAYVMCDGDYVPPAGNSDDAMLKAVTPQQLEDYRLAKEIQKIEQVGAGTTQEINKIIYEETKEAKAQANRTERSNYNKKN